MMNRPYNPNERLASWKVLLPSEGFVGIIGEKIPVAVKQSLSRTHTNIRYYFSENEAFGNDTIVFFGVRGNKFELKKKGFSRLHFLAGFPRVKPRIFVDCSTWKTRRYGFSMYTPNSYVGSWGNRLLKYASGLGAWVLASGLKIEIWAKKKSIEQRDIDVPRSEWQDILGALLSYNNQLVRCFAIYTGSVDIRRKISVRIQLQTGSEIIVKIADTEMGRMTLERETWVLAELAASRAQFSSSQLPTVIHSGSYNGYYIQCQSVVGHGGVCSWLTTKHLKFLDQLKTINRQQLPLRNVPLYQQIVRLIDMEENTKEKVSAELSPKLWLSFLKENEESVIDCHLAHGDFAPWNIICGRKEISVFDWEDADFIAPAGLDAFHFLYRQATLVGPWSGVATIRNQWKAIVGIQLSSEIHFTLFLLNEYLLSGKVAK